MTSKEYVELLELYIEHMKQHPDSCFDFVYINFELSSKLLKPEAKVFWFKDYQGACLIYSLVPGICYIDFIYIKEEHRKSIEAAKWIASIRNYIKNKYFKVIADVFTLEGENLMIKQFDAEVSQKRYVKELK